MYIDKRPGVPITLVSSSPRTTSSNTGSLKDTTANFPQSDAVSVTVDVTAFTGGTADFNVFVDTSPDDGTTWLPIAGFGQITSSTATRSILFHNGVLASGLESAWEDNATVRSLNTGTAREIVGFPYTRDVRVRWEMNTSNSVTFAVFAVAEP